MKLLLDEHYASAIAIELRAAQHDAITVVEHGSTGADDEALLALAFAEGRALLTNNARDFLPIVGRWVSSGRDHCGLVLTSDTQLPRHKGTVGLYIMALRAILDAHPEERALMNQVHWLSAPDPSG